MLRSLACFTLTIVLAPFVAGCHSADHQPPNDPLFVSKKPVEGKSRPLVVASADTPADVGVLQQQLGSSRLEQAASANFAESRATTVVQLARP